MININTSRQYPILSLPSHLPQPSSPSVSRLSKSSKAFSASNPATLTQAPSPIPSRLSRFLASLQPLPASASLSDHERAKQRVLSHLSLTPSSASLIDAGLSHTHIDPLSSFTLTHCTGGQEAVRSLMHGLSSHSSLHRLEASHCPAELHWPELLTSLPALSSLSSLSLWGSDLSAMGAADIDGLLSLVSLTSLDLSSATVPLAALQSVAAALSSPASALSHVDLSNTGADVSVAHAIAEAFPGNTRLTSLVLHSNALPPSAVLELCASLSTNHTLTYLDLRWTTPLTAPPTTGTPTAAVATLPLEPLLSSLQANTSLLDLLLCGYADPFTSNVQSAIELYLDRNRLRREECKQGAPADTPRSLVDSDAAGATASRQSLVHVDNPLLARKPLDVRLSPPLSYRSYSNSLSSTSPFSLTLDHMPPQPAAATAAVVPATVDGKLTSVVLQQEEEIARQTKIIARLRAMCKKQEDGLKTAKVQLRKLKTAGPAQSNGSAASGASAGMGAEASRSPAASPVGSERSSFSSGGAGEGEEDAGAFRVNLDLAATVVLLETQKNEQQRLMDEMRQVLHKQDHHAAAAAASSDVPTDSSTPAPSTDPSEASPAVDGPQTDVSERGRLLAQITELRVQVLGLQAQLSQSSSGVPPGTVLRRDSGVHWANVVTSMKQESERALKEKDERIQALLSAQRVLAESREVKVQHLIREWREKERTWTDERDRLRAEASRLRRRLNRLSQEKGGPAWSSRTGSLKLHHDPAEVVPVGEGGREEGGMRSEEDEESESDEESTSGSPRFHPAPLMSSTQPLPGLTPPLLPSKPAHSMGMVIAARIAAFEARRSVESDAIREKMGMPKLHSQEPIVGRSLLSKRRSQFETHGMGEEEEQKVPE